MPRFVNVTYDAKREFALVRYLRGTLQTEQDVEDFAKEIDTQLQALVGQRKVDMIIDLGALAVKPSVVQAYDAVRLQLRDKHALRAYRYGGSSVVRTKIFTSSTIHDQQANVYETFEEALAALTTDRAR
jgi:hypothetical protein